MIAVYIAILLWFAAFMISSYSGIVNDTRWGKLVTGICLFIWFAAEVFHAVFS